MKQNKIRQYQAHKHTVAGDRANRILGRVTGGRNEARHRVGKVEYSRNVNASIDAALGRCLEALDGEKPYLGRVTNDGSLSARGHGDCRILALVLGALFAVEMAQLSGLAASNNAGLECRLERRLARKCCKCLRNYTSVSLCRCARGKAKYDVD